MLEQPSIPFPIIKDQRRLIRRGAIVAATFVAAVIGIVWSAVSMLRASIGVLFILLILRYPYLLLIIWVLLDAFIGSTLSLFQGNNFDLGLTLATIILVLARMPIKATLKQMPALAFLLIYLVWVLIGIGISPLGIRSFLTIWSLNVDYVLVGILVINLVTTQQRLMRLIDAIILITTFIAVYGIYGYFTKQNGVVDQSGTSLFRIASVFGDVAPALAMFLSVITPLIMYRTLVSRGFMRYIGWMLVGISLIAFLLTFTRTAFISFPLGIIIVIPFLPTRKLKVSFSASIGLLAVLGGLIIVVGKIPILERFLGQDVTTLNGRIYLWQALLSHFDPFKLLGNGLNASDILLSNLRVGFGGGVIATAPHNLFLGALYDHGIIGAALLIAVFLRLTVLLFARIRKTSGNQRILFAMAIVALANMLIQSLEGNDFWNQSIGIYFWICMTLPFARCWTPVEQPSETDQSVPG